MPLLHNYYQHTYGNAHSLDNAFITQLLPTYSWQCPLVNAFIVVNYSHHNDDNTHRLDNAFIVVNYSHHNDDYTHWLDNAFIVVNYFQHGDGNTHWLDIAFMSSLWYTATNIMIAMPIG